MGKLASSSSMRKPNGFGIHLKRGDRIHLTVNVILTDELEAASPLRLQFVLPFDVSVRKIEGGPSGGRFHGRTLAELLECTDSASRVSDVVGVVLAVGAVDIKKRRRDNTDVIVSLLTFGCMSMNAVVITLWGRRLPFPPARSDAPSSSIRRSDFRRTMPP